MLEKEIYDKLAHSLNYLLLDPTMSIKGVKNARWRLIVNLDEKILGELE